jgi:acetyl-CoA C-acetyltransferase
MVISMKSIQRVAILGGDRIPFARYNTAYKDLSNKQMFTQALTGLARRFNLQGKRIGEVVGGAVLKHAKDFNLTRESTLSSGLSPQTPAYDLQQACATSIQATVAVANKIALGQIDAGIAGGVDSASDVPLAASNGQRALFRELSAARTAMQRITAWSKFRPAMLKPSIADVDEPRTGLSMGQHTERMVREWNISREEQDTLALASHRNGLTAYERGFYKDLVTPFGGLERDGILRPDTSMERLAKLAPAYDKASGFGTLTAGNSTPLTDGAASVLLASEAWTQANRHQPLAWFVDAETAAVDFFTEQADGLLMAPAYAVARMLKRNNLSLADFDYYEIHEAFSGQVLCTLKAWESDAYCRERLGLDGALGAIDRSRLNVNGGSVGLGHPFAATGARIMAAAAKQLAEHRATTGRSGRTLVSVCAAGGLGVAAILEG